MGGENSLPSITSKVGTDQIPQLNKQDLGQTISPNMCLYTTYHCPGKFSDKDPKTDT